MEKYEPPRMEIFEIEADVITASPGCTSGVEAIETPPIVIGS